MSVAGRSGVGIPVVMMHEGEGCTLTIETNDGNTYRGYCVEAEDCMNCLLKDATVTDGDTGKESFVPSVYIRGDHIRFIVFPEILKHAPMFKRVQKAKKGKYVQGGEGLGRTQALRRKVEQKARARGVPPRSAGGAGAGAAAAPRPGMGMGMGMMPRGPMAGAGWGPRGPMPMGMPRGMPPRGMYGGGGFGRR